MATYPDAQLVLDGEYVSDSTGIIDKYGLRRYYSNLTWNSKLYNSLSKTEYSEVVQICDGTEVQRFALKTLASFSAIQCASENTSCTYTTPKDFNFYVFEHFTFIQNYITDDYFVLDKAKNQLKKIYPDGASIKKIESLFSGANPTYKYGFDDNIRTGALKPKVIGITELNDRDIVYTLLTYYIEAIKGNDTSCNKIISLVTVRDDQVIDVALVNTMTMDGKWIAFENKMFSYKGGIYFVVGPLSSSTVEHSELKIIAKFDREGNSYIASSPCPFLLNDYYKKFYIGYNYTTPFESAQFVAFGLSDVIIDLEKNKTFSIPLERQLFESNSGMGTTKSPNYILGDIAYDKRADMITALYRMDGIRYVARFKPYATKADTIIKLFPMSYYKNVVKSVSLSHNGRRLQYVLRTQNCIQECEFDQCAEIMDGIAKQGN